MKITERLYINRLEEMVKLHKDNLCDHCPMAEEFDSKRYPICEVDEQGEELDPHKSCNICRGLTIKYTGIGSDYACPCHDIKAADTNMVAVAWKVIHGWRRDHPERKDDEKEITLICTGCNKTPEEIDEYLEAANDEEVTPDEYVWEEEGTLNKSNGHFLCTSCYIDAGMPDSPEGWKAP